MALKSTDVQQHFIQLGYTAIGGTPEQFGATIHADLEKYGRIIKNASISPQYLLGFDAPLECSWRQSLKVWRYHPTKSLVSSLQAFSLNAETHYRPFSCETQIARVAYSPTYC